ncbi:hypothetical protein Ddye_005516 [Dipteronia dyeriana]|uniref:HAT C-terminal dimerisation domain-containing protein n=1 Tax=Dipteronia dyeriana TaxID=168575 RepID=A0AAD9XGL6_9ROSI|nr:hypothetical protein Ddye_005516 [Dipteronia dyeriana]
MDINRSTSTYPPTLAAIDTSLAKHIGTSLLLQQGIGRAFSAGGDVLGVVCVVKQGNKGKYLILAKTARDILAIPVSTVAFESVFSAGGRFLSPHRRRLRPDTLEALMYTQNWIWAPIRGGIPEDELYATIDEEEPLTSV